MSEQHNEIINVIDREKIRDCIARLARGEDRRCEAELVACFWPDAQLDFGIFAGTLKEYLHWVLPGSPAVVLTQHILGQSLVELSSDNPTNASSDKSRVETHVISYHRIDSGQDGADRFRDIVIGGRYLDALEKRGNEWRIYQRTMLYDWHQDWGAAADWSQGLMGQSFSGSHFIGKTTDDYSKTFFGRA